MARDLAVVMDRIYNCVPEDDTRREHFANRIKQIKESIPYTAPEAISMRWQDFAEYLQVNFSRKEDWDKSWIKDIMEIFAGRRENA